MHEFTVQNNVLAYSIPGRSIPNTNVFPGHIFPGPVSMKNDWTGRLPKVDISLGITSQAHLRPDLFMLCMLVEEVRASIFGNLGVRDSTRLVSVVDPKHETCGARERARFKNPVKDVFSRGEVAYIIDFAIRYNHYCLQLLSPHLRPGKIVTEFEDDVHSVGSARCDQYEGKRRKVVWLLHCFKESPWLTVQRDNHRTRGKPVRYDNPDLPIPQENGTKQKRGISTMQREMGEM